jgi:hypothetical protein
LRGKVSTTYISQKQTAAQLLSVKLTLGFCHFGCSGISASAGNRIYSGNARAWQENNYVRADKLILRQNKASLWRRLGAKSTLRREAKGKR